MTSHVLIDLYKTMLRIRRVQLKIEAEYPKDEMKTPVHLCLGQEAIPAGVCAHLEKEDYVFSNYRGHGHYLAKGGNLKALIAELYGRTTGCSGSRGGSMHIIDTSAGFLGTSSIVAGSIPIATGAALGFLLEGRANVSCVFFGDGAVDEGVLYESINFAMLKKLPVIYICENNFYAVCSAQKNRQALDNIHQRFAGCGIPGYRADGNNVVEVWRTAKEAIENARNGGGPSLIEFRTYRWRGHSGGDNDVSLGYRTQEELDEWMNKCPLKNFEQFLRAENLITEEEIRDMEIAIDREIEEAFTFAQASPLPDEKDLLKHLYKDGK
ncbi:MAG: thiamine pyrophosphate-dependent dehydrogenase E1 component subunit alpha [Candidatus Omnitrophota bacterium]|nr:MAG: thiamine pyrophosphate-dependent dehydrogenase E1 component subunit alpha [Candidatus Omnitrophota bacterium]